jgi:glycosyltransferase involved in cell wall biosynthesis
MSNKSEIKITVLVITYNNENYISRALDSISNQIEFVDEIIVSDDHSTDNTWSILNQYRDKHGKKIILRQNEFNLGINKHFEKVWKYGHGDIFFILAGDDEFCNGVFEKTKEYINKHNLNYKNEAFVLYLDFLYSDPEGNLRRHSNRMIEKHDAISLKIRNLIFNRTSAVSKQVIQRFSFPKFDFSCFADGLLDIQWQMQSDKNYYYSFPGSIYHMGIGISSRIDEKVTISANILMYSKYLQQGCYKNKSDLLWLKYCVKKFSCKLDFSYVSYIYLIFSYLRMFDIKYPFRFYYDELKSLGSLLKRYS